MTNKAPASSPTPLDPPPLSSRERDVLRRGKGTWLPLVLVLLSLALAVLLPRLTQGRIARLRNDINDVADPARLRIAEIELDLAMEGSQRRGFLLTRDPRLEQEFAATRQHRIVAEKHLLTLTRRLDTTASGTLSEHAKRLAQLDSSLDSVIATHGDASEQALDKQHEQFVAIQRVSDTLAAKIDSAAAMRRAEITETQNLVALTTAALVLLGVGAAYLVARLGARFRDMALRLDEQEARFRQIAENLSAVVWLSDPAFHRYLYVSSAYERIWGRTRESLASDPDAFMLGVHPEDRERVRTAISNIARRPADLEFRVLQPNDTIRWVWARGFPVRDSQGNLFRIAGIVEDITDRHAYAEERERLLENERRARDIAETRRSELERVTESRARLVRGFTHDVKNPLGAADGFLALWEEGVLGAVSDQQRGTITKVRRAIGHALELIAHLLDIARAEAGQLAIHRRKVNVGEQVEEVAEAFTAQAKAKQLDVDVALEPDLPLIETDPTRLRQVVGNLISNAVKYTPSGGHIRIRARHSTNGDGLRNREVIVSVMDDGPGIPAERQSALFAEFTRFDPGAAEGAGIGLAISQRIAEALGGEITVDSQPGHGSTFSLHLPS